jgi:hypothetical protein
MASCRIIDKPKKAWWELATLNREKKAATQLGVIVGAFICSWLPYFTLFMVNLNFYSTTIHQKIVLESDAFIFFCRF